MQIASDKMDPISRQRHLPSYSHYDPYRVPPNIAQSVKHYQCTMFGNDDYGKDPCPCCRQLHKLQLWFSCTLSHIETVSHSACYYFHFVINMILLSLLVFIINGILNLVELLRSCGETGENCIYIYGVPFKKPAAYFDQEHYIMDGVTILLLFVFHLFTSYQFRRLHFFERYKTRASDYTIMLSCVDHKKVSPQDLIKFFRDAGAKGHIDILYTHRIKTFIKAERLKCKLKSQLQHHRYNRASEHTIKEIQKKIEKAENDMLPTINTFYFNQEQTIRTDKVFVTFSTRDTKEDIAKRFKTGEFKRISRQVFGSSASININQCQIVLEQSAQPGQILWENLEVTNRNRFLRITVSNFIAIGLLIVSFILITLLSFEEVDTKDLDNYLSYICAIVISLVNLALSFSLEYAANKQYRITITGKLNSLMTKQTITFFFNTALIPVSMFFIFSSKDGESGLILNILTIFFLNAFINPFLLLLNIQSMFKYFKRNRLLRQDASAMLTTQSQSNEIFQKPSFQLEFKYSVVSKMIMMTVFFAGIFPLGSVFAIVSLAGNYYVNKYMLLKHSQFFRVSFKIGRRINKLNSLLPAIYGLGVLTNQYLIIGKVTAPTIVIFIISVILTLINFFYSNRITKHFYRKWVKKQALISPLTHQEAINSAGIIDYKHLNPTSCQEIKHQDLKAPTHSGQDLTELIAPPYPISQQDDKFSIHPDEPHTPKEYDHAVSSFPPMFPYLRSRPSYNPQQNPEKNRFLRSMTLYTHEFPEEKE